MVYLPLGKDSGKIAEKAESYGVAVKAKNYYVYYNVRLKSLISEIKCFLKTGNSEFLYEEKYVLPKHLCDLKINIESFSLKELRKELKKEKALLISCCEKNKGKIRELRQIIAAENSPCKKDRRIALLGPERLLLRIFEEMKGKYFRKSLTSSAILHVFRTDDDVYRYQDGEIPPIEFLGSDNEFAYFINEFFALRLLNRNAKYQQLDKLFLNSRGEYMDVNSLSKKYSHMQSTLSDYTEISEMINKAYKLENIPIPVRIYPGREEKNEREK